MSRDGLTGSLRVSAANPLRVLLEHFRRWRSPGQEGFDQVWIGCTEYRISPAQPLAHLTLAPLIGDGSQRDRPEDAPRDVPASSRGVAPEFSMCGLRFSGHRYRGSHFSQASTDGDRSLDRNRCSHVHRLACHVRCHPPYRLDPRPCRAYRLLLMHDVSLYVGQAASSNNPDRLAARSISMPAVTIDLNDDARPAKSGRVAGGRRSIRLPPRAGFPGSPRACPWSAPIRAGRSRTRGAPNRPRTGNGARPRSAPVQSGCRRVRIDRTCATMTTRAARPGHPTLRSAASESRRRPPGSGVRLHRVGSGTGRSAPCTRASGVVGHGDKLMSISASPVSAGLRPGRESG